MALNLLFKDHTAVRGHFARHAGRSVALRADPLAVCLTITQEGQWAPSETGIEPDVHVTVDTRQLWACGWMPGQPLPQAEGLVHVAGDAAMAQTLAMVTTSWRPDLEDLLAQRLGDIPARHIAGAANHAAGALTESARRVAQNAAEYLSYETGWLVPRPALLALTQRLAELQHRLDVVSASSNAVARRLDRVRLADRLESP